MVLFIMFGLSLSLSLSQSCQYLSVCFSHIVIVVACVFLHCDSCIGDGTPRQDVFPGASLCMYQLFYILMRRTKDKSNSR